MFLLLLHAFLPALPIVFDPECPTFTASIAEVFFWLVYFCSYLASVGQDDDHTVGVYDWANNKLKATAQGDKNKSLAIAFSPDGNTVCQVGVQHIRFHEMQVRECQPPLFGRSSRRLK